MIISLSLLAPEFVLNKFYPKYEQQQLSVDKIQSLYFAPDKEVHIKITRRTDYGERYKLFVINEGSFDDNFNLKTYGIQLAEDKNNLIVKSLDQNSLAKKSGIQNRDIISNFKTENLERPNKGIVYPFALLFLFGFGYFNHRRKED